MRHGMMMRTLVAAILSLTVASLASAGGNDCPCATTSPVVVQGTGTPCQTCNPKDKKYWSFRNQWNGTWAADSAFILGPSKCYFDRCYPGASDLPIGVFNKGFFKPNCPLPIYGTGIGQPANNCAGPYTNLNR